MIKAEEIVKGSTLVATIRSEFSKAHSEDLEKDLIRMINQALIQSAVSKSVCDCIGLQACIVCGEQKGLDGDFWKTLKQTVC